MPNMYRFHKAHEYHYDAALKQVKNGKKETQWMWYIFPQLRDLGKSFKSKYYGITNLHEAYAYLDTYYTSKEHETVYMDDYPGKDVLADRLYNICSVLLDLPGDDPYEIFGDDARKLKSSMTLFSKVPSVYKDEFNVYPKILKKYFSNDECKFTLENMNRAEIRDIASAIKELSDPYSYYTDDLYLNTKTGGIYAHPFVIDYTGRHETIPLPKVEPSKLLTTNFRKIAEKWCRDNDIAYWKQTYNDI